MSEAKLYTFNEFTKSIRPGLRVYKAIVRSNSELRESAVSLRDYWRDHINKSRSAIQAASGRSKTGKAIIYGAGNCNDIPLAHLVDRFDHLTVVDIESQGVTKAVEALPGNLQAKVDIQIEDLTNIIAETVDSFTRLLSRSNSPTDFAEKVLVSLPNIHPETPDFGDNYDFVCSNLLGSQLPVFVGVAFAVLGNSRYPYAGFNEDAISRQALRANRPDLVNNSVYLLQQTHIDLLLQSARKPAGIIYLADTFDQAFLKRDPVTKQPYFIDEQGRPVAYPHLIPILALGHKTVERIKKDTDIVDFDEWTWYRKPPIGTAIGQTFSVKSLTLTTK